MSQSMISKIISFYIQLYSLSSNSDYEVAIGLFLFVGESLRICIAWKIIHKTSRIRSQETSHMFIGNKLPVNLKHLLPAF